MSRGRGGWGGRGGISNTLSISTEEKLATICTQPPPLFPPSDKRPLPLTQSPDIDYMLLLRRHFVDHMQLSPSYLELPKTEENGSEQELDQLVAEMPINREKYDWNLLPNELKPQELLDEEKRKRDLKRNVKKERADKGDTESVKMEKDDDDTEDLQDGNAEDNSLKRPRAIELNEEEEPNLKRVKTEVKDEDEELVENEEEEDEEMDDGTDYINNYFDNGEDFDDDDDNGEDGSYY